MTTSRRRQRDWRVLIIIIVGSTIAGAFFGYRVAPADADPFLVLLEGAANSLLIATPIALVEINKDRIASLRRLRRLPLAAYFTIKVLFYVTMIVGGLALNDFIFHDETPWQPSRSVPFHVSFAFGVTLAVFGNLVFEMGGLLGFGTLKNLLTGRYVQPRREQRVLLLIDMRDSTGHAERLGSIRFHELLNAFFRDVSVAALECEAEIHKYVGDEVILTWLLKDGIEDGRCLECPFLTRDQIAIHADMYQQRFAVVPQFRASIHCGEIVAGEIGDVRREIAFVGDTINVAARLLIAARDLNRDVLASADLLAQMPVPATLEAEELAEVTVRGRSAPLEVSALSRVR